MRHSVKWVVIVIMGFLCVFTAYVFGSQQFHYHDITQAMNDAANIAATKSLDKSVRVKKGRVVITKSSFKSVFKEQIRKKDLKFNIENYSFEFLTGKNGATKAVRVTIMDNQNTPHTITYVASVSTG